jgi:hypothetical protein
VDFRLESFNYLRELTLNPDLTSLENCFNDSHSFYHAKKLWKESLENFGI